MMHFHVACARQNFHFLFNQSMLAFKSNFYRILFFLILIKKNINLDF